MSFKKNKHGHVLMKKKKKWTRDVLKKNRDGHFFLGGDGQLYLISLAKWLENGPDK
jgi:hypothetical protein